MGQLRSFADDLSCAVFYRLRLIQFASLILWALGNADHASATDYDRIGLSPLKREAPLLTGAGIPVGQSEGEEVQDSGRWQVNPSYATVSQPVSLFTWISSNGTATT